MVEEEKKTVVESGRATKFVPPHVRIRMEKEAAAAAAAAPDME